MKSYSPVHYCFGINRWIPKPVMRFDILRRFITDIQYREPLENYLRWPPRQHVQKLPQIAIVNHWFYRLRTHKYSSTGEYSNTDVLVEARLRQAYQSYPTRDLNDGQTCLAQQ